MNFDIVHRSKSFGIRQPTLLIAAVTFGILLSESALYFEYLTITLWGHLLTLVVCAVAPLWIRDAATICQGLILVPVFRLVNLGIPLVVDSPLITLAIIYGTLLPAVIVIAVWGDTEVRVGWKIGTITLPLALPLGLTLAELEYLFLQPDALIAALTTPQLALIGVIMIGCVALVEELIFRGLIQHEVGTYLGRWQGILLASILFAAMHMGHFIPEVIAFAFFAGLVFGYIYEKTDSLVSVILLHGIMNVFLFAILPIQGSILGPLIS